MQIGVLTIDGALIGTVSFSVGTPDLVPPPFMGDDEGVDSPGAEAPTGGPADEDNGDRPDHSQSDQSSRSKPDRPDHSHGYHTPHSHRGTEPHEPGKSTTGPVSVGKGDDPRGNEGYIRERAKAYNHDPDTAVAVAKSEGLRDFSGDHGTSFGAFQLHKHGGLGDEFQKETGLDPADPKNERAGIDWSLKNLSRTGWGPYHGAARVGIGRRDGIGTGTQASRSEVAPVATSAPREAPSSLKGDDVKAFIVHHTGGRGTPEGVQNTLRQRGLGVEYIMDREGNITQAGDRGASHMKTGWGKGEGLSNRNTVGMEVIAKDNNDVTPAQVAAGKAFLERNYPNTPVYGHGEVNPGHKEADEGLAIVNAVRASRVNAANAPKKPDFDPDTMVP